tara:strand:+ start:1111 stop:1212 length:102 start_codon:yes stop_codon:yes gene_type:complete
MFGASQIYGLFFVSGLIDYWAVDLLKDTGIVLF